MQSLPGTKSCFVCGRHNPIGLNLRFETDGIRVQTRFVPSPTHVGFRNTVHGGLIATLLDEVMVWACGVRTKRFAYCAEMTVRYAHPLQPGREVLAVGELANNRRNKLFEARGELRDPAGLVLATAVGKYLPVKQGDWVQIAEDFEPGLEPILWGDSENRP
ncbi:MAG: PaaI family thioesterase [Verrucomicrobia bacterium]|nr:PaaI family thioesterase [Verrucomicrobiota bacterium]